MNRKAFTLIELIIVIGIIGVLIGLLIPAVMKIRDRSLQAYSMNNLHQIASAIMAADASAMRSPGAFSRLEKNGGFLIYFDILPYLDQENLYRKFTLKHGLVIPPDDGSGPKLVIPVLISPADYSHGNTDPNGAGLTSYVPNYGAFHDQWPINKVIKDGLAGTLLVSERMKLCGTEYNRWFSEGPKYLNFGAAPPPENYAPRVDQCDMDRLCTPHSTVILVAMADLTARAVAQTAASNYWGSAAGPDDGAVPDW